MSVERSFKNGLSLRAKLPGLHLATSDPELKQQLNLAKVDLISLTRADVITVSEHTPQDWTTINAYELVSIYLPV